MIRLKKVISAVFVAALIVTSVAGCGQKDKAQEKTTAASTSEASTQSKPKKPVSLRFAWWGGDTRHKATLDAIALYKQKYPHVTIDAEYGGFDGYEQKLKMQLAGGAAPDLMQVDQPWLADLVNQNEFFADIKKLSTIDIKGFDDSFLKGYCVFNNKLVGLPTGLSSYTLIVNKDLMAKSGIDANVQFDPDNLLEIGKKLHDQDKTKYLWHATPSNTATVLKMFVSQKTGKQFVNDDYTLGFDKKTMADVFAYMVKYIDNGVITTFEESAAYDKKTETAPKWMKGEFVFTGNWASTVPSFKKDVPFAVDVMRPIVAKDAKLSAIITRPSQVFCLNSKTAAMDELSQFVNWFFNDKEAALILGTERGVPPTEVARKALADANKMDPTISKAVDIALKSGAYAENTLSTNAELVKILEDVVQKVGFKKLTPEQGADDLIKRFEEKLKELKSLKK